MSCYFYHNVWLIVSQCNKFTVFYCSLKTCFENTNNLFSKFATSLLTVLLFYLSVTVGIWNFLISLNNKKAPRNYIWWMIFLTKPATMGQLQSNHCCRVSLGKSSADIYTDFVFFSHLVFSDVISLTMWSDKRSDWHRGSVIFCSLKRYKV